MDIIYKKVDELIPYGRNNKIHNNEQIKLIASSIKEFGFKQPIVIDSKNGIVAGHGRVEAAKLSKIEEVPCIIADDLTKEQINAYRIADNKLNESKWQKEFLKVELELLDNDGFDIELTGFDLDFLKEEEKEIPEKEFTKELLERHEYVVIYFDNELDWQVAKEKFGIKTVKGLQAKGGMKKEGVGRIIEGTKVLEMFGNV